MAAWQEFANAEPEMAQLLLDVLAWIPISYLATTRPDGAPRVHPVCPIIAGGRVFIATADNSPKRLDLRDDRRYAMHALPGKWRPGPSGETIGDDEFYMTGRAHLIEDDETRRLVTQTAKHAVRAEDWIFELDIERVMTAYWEKVGQPGTYAVRRYWRVSS